MQIRKMSCFFFFLLSETTESTDLKLKGRDLQHLWPILAKVLCPLVFSLYDVQ